MIRTSNLDRLVSTRFQFKEDVSKHDILAVTFDRMTSPYYEGERWAVRRGGSVLAIDGEWEYEPSPSNRDDEFYSRCRFNSLEDAVAAYDKVLP